MQAIRDVEPEVLRRYPDASADLFRTAVAKALGNDITPDMILCGNGADDLLTIATRTFVGHDGTLAAAMPGYPAYPVHARLEEAKFVAVNWDTNWTLPTDDLLATKANAIYLANPNSISGTVVPNAQLAKLADDFAGVVLIDEAFVDFADDNALPLLKDYNNLVIVRSLSKGYSLAGLRFGYAIANAAVIEQMGKAKYNYNVDSIAMIAATAAIEDREHAAMTWEHVRNERARLTGELAALGWSVTPSQASFVLAKVPGGEGRAMYEGLKRQGILVRHFDKSGLADKLRITNGTSQENNALLGGIKALSASEKAA
jgi:histidinol-phosphate aminotransferase